MSDSDGCSEDLWPACPLLRRLTFTKHVTHGCCRAQWFKNPGSTWMSLYLVMHFKKVRFNFQIIFFFLIQMSFSRIFVLPVTWIIKSFRLLAVTFHQSANFVLHMKRLFLTLNRVEILFSYFLGLLWDSYPVFTASDFSDDVVMQSTYLIYSRSGNVISANICSLLTLKTRATFLFLKAIFLNKCWHHLWFKSSALLSSEDIEFSFYILTLYSKSSRLLHY